MVRCLSVPYVRLPVTRRYYVETAKHIIKLYAVGWPNHPSFSIPNVMAIFWLGPSNGGVECRVFLHDIFQCQVAQKRHQIDIIWRTNKKSYMVIERRHFQWPRTTRTPSFKATTFFDAEYLRNGARYRHSFNEMLIGTYTRPTHSVIANDLEWPWMT